MEYHMHSSLPYSTIPSAVAVPAELVSKQMVPDGPAAIEEERFPPDHFHTHPQVTGTKSWQKSLTPASSAHLHSSS